MPAKIIIKNANDIAEEFISKFQNSKVSIEDIVINVV